MNLRTRAIGHTDHPWLTFGNDFCFGILSLPFRTGETSGFRYISSPIFEILN